MSYYQVNGQVMTKEELLDHIEQVFQRDRNEARILVYEHGISWHELAMRQRNRREEVA